MKLPFAWLLAGTTLLAATSQALAQRKFSETDLASDVPGRAKITDANLVNGWGLVPGPSGVFWVSNQGTGTSTLYQPDGTKLNLVVSIPGGGNTGVVLADPTEPAFRIPSADTTARAIFIFATEHGTIAAWSPTVNQTNAIEVASTPEAVYLGLAIANTSSGQKLYVANFHAGTIDVFDRDFHPVTLSGDFTDPNLPADYGPFNVANIAGKLYVAYAKQAPNKEDELAGPGLGLIDVYDTNGHFLRRLVSNGPLNAPWGMVLAPVGFGAFGGDLLVGNLGDGRINAFSLTTGKLLGALQDSTGQALSISGLWGLHFGRQVSGADVAQRLYFAAGIEDETHGLFGYLSAIAAPVACQDRGGKNQEFWRAQCAGGRSSRIDDDGSGRDRGDRDGDRDGDDHKKDRHPSDRGVSADSLRALFDCVSSFSRAFGPAGCFTAGCELLNRRDPGARAQAAQQFLTLLLDRCAGLTCDETALRCGGGDRHRDGDDDGLRRAGGPAPRTVGDLVALLDSSLCENGSSASFVELGRLAACAIRSQSGHRDDEDGDDDRDASSIVQGVSGAKLEIVPLGGNPVSLAAGLGARFVVSSPVAASVRVGIYDAAGRLIAEPLRGDPVSGPRVVRWDGRNLNGTLVPPGTYFYRAVAGSSIAGGRIVVMR